MTEEKKVTIRDIEQENVEFERGIWVFLAENLFDLRRKMQQSLNSYPNYEKQKQFKSRAKIKPTISKYN